MRIAVLLIGLLLMRPLWAEPPRVYLEIIPVFWGALYPDGGQTLYCGQPFGRHDRDVNIEHVFPMSWVTKSLGCGDRRQCRANSALFNRIESDMHNLYPALKDINKARGAMAFDKIPGENYVSSGCKLEIDRRRRKVEPRPEVRGEVARAMLYMEDRYGLAIYPRQKALLREWHRLDPPDGAERERNARIERIQGQRNRFIDQP